MIVVAGIVLLVAVAMSASADARATAARCEGSREAPNVAREQSARGATLCLINAQRARRGVPALHAEARLAVAAQRQATDMVTRGYFSHVTPGGATLTDRLRRARYVTRRCAWRVGETLAWGYGTAITPASRVRAWMHSRAHRLVLLDPTYHDAGIGVVEGRPDGGPDGATYSAEFGRRRC